MNRIFNPRSFRKALFWRFFTSYFVLILIPAIVASTLAYFFVVRLIEDDAEKLNNAIMRNYSEQTDAVFSSLQTDMINMLSASDLKSFLKIADHSPDNQQRNELIHSLMGQLNKFETADFVSGAYLHFVKYDLVIDFNTHTGKEFYLKYYYPVEKTEISAFLSNFTGKKMMYFTQPYTVYQKPLFEDKILSASNNISALMSYPFNTGTPEVYLVVNVNLDKLRERLRMPENWVTGTAIVDTTGRVISRTGSSEIDGRALLETIRSHEEGSLSLKAKETALSYMKSRFEDSWYYVSLVDPRTLLKPARMIRMTSLGFLGFFLLLGSIISYALSRRLYTPILEIKTGLESHRKSNGSLRHEGSREGCREDGHEGCREGNDFDVIKRFSKLLISENQELSQLVSGMVPIVREQFVAKMLLGECRDRSSIEYYAKEFDFPLNPQAARTVLCIEIQYYSRILEQLSEASKSFSMAELKETIRKWTPLQRAPATVWICQTKSDLLACVVHHDPLLPFGPKEAAETLKTALQPFAPYFKATIGIGKTVHAIEELYASYDHAVAMLQYKGLHSAVEILSEDNVPDDLMPWDGFLSVHEVNRIFNLFKSREHDKLLHSVLDLLETGMRKNASACQVKTICADVLNTWIRAVETERNDFSILFYSRLFDMLSRSVTWDELRQCFRDIHASLFRTEETNNRSAQFAEIVEYIHDHYAEELSIERFAQRMNMSVGHFSRMFKEEVGEKYVEYIAKIRLAKAKQLLLETDMKIDDIAEKVGYWGRNSLIPIFRKYEGITPAKYRAIHQR